MVKVVNTKLRFVSVAEMILFVSQHMQILWIIKVNLYNSLTYLLTTSELNSLAMSTKQEIGFGKSGE